MRVGIEANAADGRAAQQIVLRLPLAGQRFIVGLGARLQAPIDELRVKPSALPLDLRTEPLHDGVLPGQTGVDRHLRNFAEIERGLRQYAARVLDRTGVGLVLLRLRTGQRRIQIGGQRRRSTILARRPRLRAAGVDGVDAIRVDRAHPVDGLCCHGDSLWTC